MHKEMKIAIYVLLFAAAVGFFLGFFAGRASACDSYQDCMSDEKKQDAGIGVDFVSTNGSNAWTADNQFRSLLLQKAIAFKLDEISKKLSLSDSMKRAAAQNDMEIRVDCARGFITDRKACEDAGYLNPNKSALEAYAHAGDARK